MHTICIPDNVYAQDFTGLLHQAVIYSASTHNWDCRMQQIYGSFLVWTVSVLSQKYFTGRIKCPFREPLSSAASGYMLGGMRNYMHVCQSTCKYARFFFFFTYLKGTVVCGYLI